MYFFKGLTEERETGCESVSELATAIPRQQLVDLGVVVVVVPDAEQALDVLLDGAPEESGW